MGDAGVPAQEAESTEEGGTQQGKQNCIVFMERSLTDWPTLMILGGFLVGMVIVAQLAVNEGNTDRIKYGNIPLTNPLPR